MRRRRASIRAPRSTYVPGVSMYRPAPSGRTGVSTAVLCLSSIRIISLPTAKTPSASGFSVSDVIRSMNYPSAGKCWPVRVGRAPVSTAGRCVRVLSGVRPVVTPVRSRLGGIMRIPLPPGTYLPKNISHLPLKGYADTLRQPPMRTASAMTKPRTHYMPSRHLRGPLPLCDLSLSKAVRISDRSCTVSRATASSLMPGSSCI